MRGGIVSAANDVKVDCIGEIKDRFKELLEFIKQKFHDQALYYRRMLKSGSSSNENTSGIEERKEVFLLSCEELKEEMERFLPSEKVIRVLQRFEEHAIMMDIHRGMVRRGGFAAIDKIAGMMKKLGEDAIALSKIYGTKNMKKLLESGVEEELKELGERWLTCAKLYVKVEKANKNVSNFVSGGCWGGIYKG